MEKYEMTYIPSEDGLKERIDELTTLLNNKKITIGLVKFINQLSSEAEAITNRFESRNRSTFIRLGC